MDMLMHGGLRDGHVTTPSTSMAAGGREIRIVCVYKLTSTSLAILYSRVEAVVTSKSLSTRQPARWTRREDIAIDQQALLKLVTVSAPMIALHRYRHPIGPCIPSKTYPTPRTLKITKKSRLVEDFRGRRQTTRIPQTIVRRGLDGFQRTWPDHPETIAFGLTLDAPRAANQC
ncbi:hypothetical protein ACN22W_37330 [Burkholderia theae]|uniref:hypothetical protein n=1 Tax=Burkholderia theae TaxID=3143496 RepID=UPI003AFB15C7